MNLWFFATILFALADWTALWKKWPKVNYFTKPSMLVALILWFTTQGGWQVAPLWFGMALVFSLLGDIFLLLPDNFFIFGLIAFLLAHVGFIIGFSPQTPTANLPTLIIGVGILILSSYLFNKIRKSIKANPSYVKLNTLLLIYCIALSMMFFSAMLTLVQAEWLSTAAVFVAVGGMLFFASDNLLAYNRFVKPLPNGRQLVRIMYHLGQIALTSGILLNFLSP